MTAGIVAGVDGSPGGGAALRWAAREAQLRGLPLTAVLASDEPAAGETLDAAVTAVLGSEAGPVARVVVDDHAGRALVRAAEGADLLVVGARGRSGVEELVLGSVSQEALHHAVCPVAVVRGADPTTAAAGHVVVGVDGSPASREALPWAVDEARRRGARLTVVRAHLPPYLTEFPEESGLVWSDGTDETVAREALDGEVEAVDTSGVSVERLLVADSPGPAIVAVAADADLVVVGSRGLGGVRGRLVGSVSLHVTHHATCPVVVIRAR